MALHPRMPAVNLLCIFTRVASLICRDCWNEGQGFRPNNPGIFTFSVHFKMDFWKHFLTLAAVREIPIILRQAEILSKVINRFETKLGAGRPVLCWTA